MKVSAVKIQYNGSTAIKMTTFKGYSGLDVMSARNTLNIAMVGRNRQKMTAEINKAKNVLKGLNKGVVSGDLQNVITAAEALLKKIA